MSAAHTPGPWKAVKESRHCYRVDFSRGTVVDLFRTMDESKEYKEATEHDARLIAAAPELLDALQAMVESYQHEASISNPALLAARAAIAKATQP